MPKPLTCNGLVPLGGYDNDDYGRDVTVDQDGNMITVGQFYGHADFNPGASSDSLFNDGDGTKKDAFIQKVDANGNYLWSKSLGTSPYTDWAFSVATDVNNNIYFTGAFRDTVTFDSTTLISNGYSDIFLIKLDMNGNLVWAQTFGSSSFWGDNGFSIAVTDSGDAYVTGYFSDTVHIQGSTIVSHGGADVYVAHFDTDGQLVWVKAFGGSDFDSGNSIFVDANKNVYVAGDFLDTVDFNPGAGVDQMICLGYDDAFILKLDMNGEYVWAKTFGQAGDYDYALGVAVDSESNVFTAGWFIGTVDFDPGADTVNVTSHSLTGYDGFVQKLDENGNFVWAQAIGGNSSDLAQALALDADGYVYITGYVADTVNFGAYDTVYCDSYGDYYILKLDNDGNYVYGQTFGSIWFDQGSSITVDASNNIYVTGQIEGSTDFDPTSGIFDLSPVGVGRAIFVQKLGQEDTTSVNILTHNFGTNFNAYPNPTSGRVNIDLGTSYNRVIVTVRNVLGQVVSTKNYGTTNRIAFDLNGITGIYCIYVQTADGTKATFKTIKN